MIKVYDVVKLVKDIPEEGLVKGQKGTILEIYNESHCEIEFCDENGFTLYLGSMLIKDLKLVWSS
jgi:hypothetical protein